MPINITPLLDALQAKLASADSDTALTDINTLNYLATYASKTNNVIRYPKISFLNIQGTGDSADSYTGDFGYDISNNKYYFRTGFQWNELTLNDSAAINQNRGQMGENGAFIYGGGTAGFPSSVQYYPFVSPFTTTSSIGTLTLARSYGTGARDFVNEKSYHVAGYAAGAQNLVESHPNASSGLTVSNVGNVSAPAYRVESVTSPTDCYVHMGYRSESQSSAIDKFAYGSSVTGSDFGDIPAVGESLNAVEDIDAGKGYIRGASTNAIYAFPFSSTVGFIASPEAVSPATTAATVGGAAYCNPTHGYFQQDTGVEKMDFASGNPYTVTVIESAPVAEPFLSHQAPAASTTAGYVAGPSPTNTYIVVRTFANDTSTTTINDSLVPNLGPSHSVNSGSHW